MKVIFVLILFIFCHATWAQVTPGHVESMLNQMVRENVISATEADKAKMRLKNISQEQWSEVNKQTSDVLGRTPASTTPSQNKIEEVNQIDLESVQFKAIQNEVKKIIPEYRDPN